MKVLKKTILTVLLICTVLPIIIYAVDQNRELTFIYSNETLKNVLIGILTGAILALFMSSISYMHDRNKKILLTINTFRKIYHDIVILNFLTVSITENAAKSIYTQLDIDNINAISNDYYTSVINAESYTYEVDFLIKKSKMHMAFLDFCNCNIQLHNAKNLLSSFIICYLKTISKKQQIEYALNAKKYNLELIQEYQTFEIRTIAQAHSAIYSLQILQNDLDIRLNNLVTIYSKNNEWTSIKLRKHQPNEWPIIKQKIHQSAENIVTQRNM